MERCPYHWLVVREPADSPHKEPVMRSFDILFSVSRTLLNKQSSCQRLKRNDVQYDDVNVMRKEGGGYNASETGFKTMSTYNS